MSCEGLDIYEEVHQQEGNIFIHFLFLPGVFYGIFRGIPAMLDLDTNIPFSIMVSTLYTLMYAYDCAEYAIQVPIMILPYIVLSSVHYHSRRNHVRESLFAFGTCLLIQEVIGHTFIEEVNSRLTVGYVSNAVLYSPMFYSQNVYRFFATYLFQLYMCLWIISF